MPVFHLRRDAVDETWAWALVSDEDGQRRVLAASTNVSPTKGECMNAIEQFRRDVTDATTTVDTTLPRLGGRWRTVDPTTGEIGGPSRPEAGEYDEGETGPPPTVFEKPAESPPSPPDAA